MGCASDRFVVSGRVRFASQDSASPPLSCRRKRPVHRVAARVRPPGWQLAARAAKNRHVKNEDLVRDRMAAVCILGAQMPNRNSPVRNARPTTLRRASKANQSTLHAVLTPPPRGPPGDPHVLPRTSGTNGGAPMCTNGNARRAVTFAVCYAPHRQLWIRQSPAPPVQAPGSVVSMCGSYHLTGRGRRGSRGGSPA